MKICVVGIGYIGLPTAVMFAKSGHDVLGVDLNRMAVNALNEGRIIIEEPYLDEVVKEAVASGRLKADVKPSISDAYILCVPTPIMSDRTADMRAVCSAAKSIVPLLKKGDIVILESTSPPGTTRDLLCPILAESGLDPINDLAVAYCPERVLPGQILKELRENSRVVGGMNASASERVKTLYQAFVEGEIVLSDATTAEMTKLMENTYRDVNIALANELAMVCEEMSINAWDVIRMANRHPRVNLHQPGPGVGGHCIAVDPWFIVEKHPETARIIRMARETNDGMPHHVLGRIKQMLPNGGHVLVLGVTYKPDVDDMRESPVIELVHLIRAEAGFTVEACDPHVDFEGSNKKDLQAAAASSDLMLLAVNHREFAKPDFEQLFKVVKQPLILDTRNFWQDGAAEKAGFTRSVLGKGRDIV